MSRTPYAGPKLPQSLLDKVGASNTSRKAHTQISTRKTQRQAERKEKASRRSQPRQHAEDHSQRHGAKSNRVREEPRIHDPPKLALGKIKIVKSILKKPVVAEEDVEPSDSDLEGEDEEEEEVQQKPSVSRAVRTQLDEDDAEIAALERKLGIKNKSSTAMKEDGLDWIANGNEDHSGSDTPQQKRTRQEDEAWLLNKRRRFAQHSTHQLATRTSRVSTSEPHDIDSDEFESFGEESDQDSDDEDIPNPFSEDEISDDDLSSLEENSISMPKKPRENPYVAPLSAESSTTTTKYIPPSLRRAQLGASEDLSQLRRQIQGQLNRLSDTNFLSILQAVEDLYARNARQHVSTTLIGLLSELVNAPSTLSETFLILYAGFATAIFKVVGADFAASLLERFTADIDQLRASSHVGKNVLNMIGFLANTYVLQMIGSSILFSYIKQFLHELTEDNTELLLRIIRTSGTQLRSDDPTSLKDIVLLLTRTVSANGQASLSVRTKFMIETINDLKNNRMKTNQTGSALTSENIVSMRKTLGSLNSKSLRATEPLQVSLEDLADSDKKGKWWLVGSSYHDPAKLAGVETTVPNGKRSDLDDGYESETPGHVSLQKLARSQGMNTDIRRSIFISIMSATDYEDAFTRIAKLSLKNKQIGEVPKVILHCAGAEGSYNPYYTIVARRLCADKRLQKVFQSALWDVLRKLSVTSQGADGLDTADYMSFSTIVNLGRLFGTLIADHCLPLTALKTVEFSYPSAQLQSFVEVLLTTVLLQCSKQAQPQAALKTVFTQTAAAARMIPALRLFVEQTLTSASLANGAKERKAVKNGCQVAVQALAEAATSTVALDDDDSDVDDLLSD